jgi:dGTPase
LQVIAEAAGYDGTLRASVALKRLTSDLVGRFATAAVEATRAAWTGQSLCRYAADLEIPAVVAAEVALLKTVALRYVMSDPRHHERQAEQCERIRFVADRLLAGAPQGLDPILLPWWEAATDDTARVRVIVDQIASYTESRLERIAAR